MTLTSIEDGLWEEEQLPEPDSKKGLKFVCVVAQFADGLILGGVWFGAHGVGTALYVSLTGFSHGGTDKWYNLRLILFSISAAISG